MPNIDPRKIREESIKTKQKIEAVTGDIVANQGLFVPDPTGPSEKDIEASLDAAESMSDTREKLRRATFDAELADYSLLQND